MKITIEVPIGTALRLKSLLASAKADDPRVVKLVALLTEFGIDVKNIKLT